MDQDELNQMLLQLTLSTGACPGSLNFELNRLLEASIPVFIDKLQCSGGAVLQIREEEVEMIFHSPGEEPARPFYGILAADLQSWVDNTFPEMYKIIQDECYHHVFFLRNFGALVLSRKQKMDAALMEDLVPVTKMLTYSCCSFVEIVKRREAEEKLNKERMLLRTIIENIPDPIYVKDREGRKMLLNRAEADLLGIASTEEAIGKTDADFYPADVAEKTRIEDALVVETKKELIHCEGRVVTRTGEEFWFDGNKIPFFDSSGEVAGIVGISHNITNSKKTEAALRENAEKYQSIFNSFIDLYYQSDLQGNILVLSPSVYKLSGYRPEELIGKPVSVVYADIEKRNEMIDLLIRKGSINDYENVLVKKDGTRVPVSITSHLIKGHDGKPRFIEGSIRDITERKEALEKLGNLLHLQNLLTHLATEFINIPVENSDAAVNRLLQLIGEHNQIDRVYIFRYDFTTRMMSNTHEWCAEGITPELENLQDIPFSLVPAWVDTHVKGEMLTVPDVSLLDPENALRQILEPQGIKTLITIPMILDGSCLGFVGFDSVRIVKNWSREEITFLQLLADLLCNVADRKRTEKALVTREAYLKAVFNNVPYQMWLKDPEGRYLLVNQPFLDYFSFTDHDSPIGKMAQDLWPLEISQSFIDQDNEVLQIKNTKFVEEQVDFHGKKVWFEIYRAPIIDPRGKLLGTTGIARDITSRIMAGRELKKATEAAEASNIAKTRFLANMSHEIRTPLNAITGMIRLLSQTMLDESQMTLLGNMHTSSDNLLTIINDILDFSKIESGQIDLEATDFNIHNLFRRVYDGNEYRAEEKNIKLQYTVEPAIPEFLNGDPVRLQQILNNLVSNAIKFTKEGKVELIARLTGPGKDKIQFMVTDTGIGISPENQKKIFESFQQEDESITRNYGGTGLGLSISRQLVELMGGELQLESTKNMGSSFFFTIPVSVGSAIKTETIQPQTEATTLSLEGSRILLVEDNKFNQFIAQAIIEKWGAKIVTAEDGLQAIEKLKAETFDLILMDIQMPVMDGITAAVKIRNELKIDTPILALTANVIKGIIERCEAAGMQGYVSKPFDEKELLSKIILTISRKAEPEPQKASPERIVWDLSRLSKMADNDKQMIRKMVLKFLEVTPDYMQELLNATRANDLKKINQTAHKLISSVNLVAMDFLRDLNWQIEQNSFLKQDVEKIPDLVHEFSRYYDLLIKQLSEEVDRI
jgi:PAS domain S-box-containing protein